jgi:hypothetical protein
MMREVSMDPALSIQLLHGSVSHVQGGESQVWLLATERGSGGMARSARWAWPGRVCGKPQDSEHSAGDLWRVVACAGWWTSKAESSSSTVEPERTSRTHDAGRRPKGVATISMATTGGGTASTSRERAREWSMLPWTSLASGTRTPQCSLGNACNQTPNSLCR